MLSLKLFLRKGKRGQRLTYNKLYKPVFLFSYYTIISCFFFLKGHMVIKVTKMSYRIIRDTTPFQMFTF